MAGKLTQDEAEQLAKQHQHLKGKPIDNALPGRVINTVAAAPYDEENQHSYIRHFLFTGDAEEALDGYTGDDFDVLVLSFIGEDIDKVIWKRLDMYLDEGNSTAML